jgi:hypothetical protein
MVLKPWFFIGIPEPSNWLKLKPAFKGLSKAF